MQLTKHHGLGNDFLVCIADHVPDDAPHLARALCHRTHGVGADGLLFATPAAGYDRCMTLYNADGSVAEMSGNGIRCFAQAIVLSEALVPAEHSPVELRLLTGGGPRTVQVFPGADPLTVMATVDMGPVADGPDLPHHLDLAALGISAVDGHLGTADLGNPHLVVHVPDPAAVAVADVGPAIEAAFPAGVNVEFVTPRGPEQLDLVVWERGVGVTQACGTGACAAATLAHRWGLVEARVAVHMPGGQAGVEVGDHAVLVGPSVLIARVEVPDVA